MADTDPFGVSLATDLPANENEAAQLAGKADELARAFEANIASLAAAVDAARRKARERHEAIIPNNAPRSQLQSIMGLVDDAVEADVREYRNALTKETEPSRVDQLRQLDETRGRLSALLAVHPSPVAMLSAQGLGSEERSRYHQQIAHASTAELANLGRLALQR